MFLGVDTGGTFTDFVVVKAVVKNADRQLSIETHKVLSTPDAPERAILQGIKELGLEQRVSEGKVSIVHGSTVATNAALEGKGVKTVFVTNRGFKDLLGLARQTRPELYALHVSPRAEPVPKQLCLETGGRLDAKGQTLDPLSDEDLQTLLAQIKTLEPEAIAINLLFSFLNSEHEEKIEQFLKQSLEDGSVDRSSVFITRSSAVLPEYREYERGIATWLNASLGPLVKRYLLTLQEQTQPSPLGVMQSSGGTISASQAAEKAVNLLLSGPAGGLAAAHFLGKLIDQSKLMTFDMGGTSTDVALIDGEITLTSEGKIGDYPVAVSMVDMHTIGAGGGSIASVDEGNLLTVGPQSAGADPGPACYGKGGTLPTVTDANLVLGRLPASISLGGNFQPDLEAARATIENLAKKLVLTVNECAEGIIKLANEHMARALRVISVERGYDPAGFRLCCFGGAGGLHLCALAEALNMSRALVPVHSGVLSALGMVLAPVQRQKSHTFLSLLNQTDPALIKENLLNMLAQAYDELDKEGIKSSFLCHTFSLDLRYQGQSSWLNIVWEESLETLENNFHSAHAQRFGHALSSPVEIVNLRVMVTAESSLSELVSIPKEDKRREGEPVSQVDVIGYSAKVPVYERNNLILNQELTGPSIVLEPTATTFIDIGWKAKVDNWGNLLLEKFSTDQT